MRGDSLRDFYAKTLAVLGLALLAGAGAAVDYWPVGSSLPAVKAVRLPGRDIPMLAQNFDRQIPAPLQERRVFVRGTIHAKNVGTARNLPAATTAPVETARVQTAPVAHAMTEVAPAPVPDLTAPITEVTGEMLAPSGLDWAMAVKLAPAPQGTGFVGGALKKTRDSIVRTGAVTGATIADAFKGVFGAFKKVSPF